MDDKKVNAHFEPQSKINKIKDSTEIFVLSPLFLQNLGISFKDITQETSSTGKKKDDVNVENKQQVNSSDDLPVSNKIQQDETSIAETANLMKNSVFMSPTFVPQDNNENLIEIVKSEENGKPNNLTLNEETISEINFLEDATVQSAAQIVSSDALNENCLYKKSIDSTQLLTESALGLREIHNISPLRDTGPSILKSNVLADTTALCGAQITSSDGVNSEKDIDNTQLLAECTLVSRINDNISPLRNTGPNDYVCKNSILNEQNTLILSIPNDMAISCESHIKEYNSQNQDSNFLGQNVEIGKIQIVTDISHQEASVSLRSNENEQGSDKKNDSFEQQASYSDNITTEYIEILNVNKDSDLISDDLIELNELISINNNNIVNTVPENRTMNECVGISMLIETDFMDFECIDSLHSSDTSLQNVKNDKNHHILEKLNKMDVIEQKQFLHENEDVHKRNQNDVSAPPSHLKTTNDMDKNIEGAQYSFTNDATEDNVILSLHQIEEHRHLSDLSINDDQSMPRIKLCQFTKTCHTHCNKEDDVPNVTEEVNTTEFVDNSETTVFVPAVAKNVDNRNIESISVMDVDSKLQNCSTSTSSLNKTDGKYVQNNFLVQESVQLPKSSLLMDAHENSVNCDISKTEIYVANSNLDQNLSVCQDQECLSEVSTASNVKSKIQAKKHKAILCDKLKNSKSKMQETKKHRRDYSKCEAENVNALTPTYKNQFSLTGNISDAVTNVNLIASYLKKITQIHSQGQNFKSLKNSKKISKVSVQGVEKPGGSNELLLEQENDFQLNTNLSIKKTYNKKNVLSKQSLAIRPIVNKICDETLCHNNYSLDYVEKPVSVNVTMGFCVCVDYGHLFYDNNYVDLEHLHYQNKFSDDSNITNQGSFNFNFNMSLSDEISEAMKDVTETPDIHINSICWKTIEESIEQNECITDEKNQIKDNNILTLGNKCIEKTVSNANILENDNVKTMDNLKMADSDNLFQHKCCFDPKVRNRSGFDFDANDFLPIVRKSLVSSDNLVTKKDSTMYGMKTSDAIEIQKLTMQSENLLTLSSSAKVDNAMDEKIQNEHIVNVALPMAVPSKRSLNHLMNANDENDSKKLKLTVNNSAQNNMNINSNRETLSQCSEFTPCDNCKLNVKTDEWINHKCLNNRIIFEENSNLSELSQVSDVTNETRDLSSNQDYLIMEDIDNSKSVNESTLSKVDDKVIEIKQTFVCGVCEEFVKNTEWVNHIQAQHDYLAWKKGDPEIDFNGSNSIKEHLIEICKTFGLLICKHCGLKQKRYRRSYEKYIDVYLEHVDVCANKLIRISNVANETQDLSSNQDYGITDDINNSQSLNESTLSEVNEKVNEIEQTFICGVCEQVVENTQWIEHIRTQHNYLAWKKSDPEIDFNDSNNIKEHLMNISKAFGLLICKHCGLKQKRYKRSYDKYIDIYLKHADLCANQALGMLGVTNKMQNQSSNQDSIINVKSNVSLVVNHSRLPVIDDKNIEMMKDIICGVCEEAVKCKEWLKHIQIQHNYFAWKKGDPELDLKNMHELEKHLLNICNEIRYLFCNKCGIRINRYLKTDERYVQCFMEHIEKCNADVETKNKAARQDLSMNHNSKMTCNVNGFFSKIGSEKKNITGSSGNIQNVTCGVCCEVVSETLWIEHTKNKHNYIAWQQGDTPLDLNNLEEIESFLIELTKNIGSLSCHKCEMRIKKYKRTYENYVKLFLKHLEECKGNAVPNEKDKKMAIKGTVSCAVCSHEMNQNEWNNHLLHKHYNLAWRAGLDEPLDLQNTSVIIRQLKDYNKNRKMTCNNCGISRISILGFFAHIIACQKTEEEIAPFKFKCEICGASSLKVYYQQHMAGHKVQELNEEKKKLRLETAPKEDEFIATVPRGKRKAAHKAMVVLEKYKATNSKYKCDMCEFRTECEQELLGHKCDLDGTSCVDSDDSANLSMQSSDESSGEEDENLSEEENQIVNKKKHSKESATSQKSFTVPFTVKNVDMYLKDGCNKFMEFHYTNETLFDEWLHCHFQEIPLEEVEKYLPPLSESCKIKYGNQWASYKRFEATEGEGYCLFTGACVSCMAWAPGPADALQMLAVATCNSIDMPRFSHDALYEHPGLIQIWSCGSLGDKLPDFSLGIVHDFGTIWSIDWCPSGAQAPMSEDPSSKSRLGLLAAACSNGFAYIFSVPHPSSMPNKFYKLHPAAELRLWAKSDQPKHQATAISWSKQKGHSVVAVGYSNGTTAMFDLNSDSPILKYKENDTTIFYPYSADYSVCSSITGISMYPTMEVGSRTTGLEVLGCSSTMGAMLQVKAAGGAPHAVYSKLAVNGAEFMSPWPALFVAMDDNTSIKPLSELEMWGVGRRAGGARTVAACVCCPRLFTWTPPLLRSVRTHPLYPETKRSVIAAIEMVPLNDEDHKPKRQKVDDDLSFKVEPTVYEDAILKYGIRYQPINYEKRRKAGKVFTGAVRSDMYPLAEVRALAACPSPPRHDWLAVGLHAGFVVVVRT